MKKLFLLGPLSALLIVGCHKKEAPVAPSADAVAAAPADAPAAQAAAPVPVDAPPAEPVAGEVNPFLTEQLKIFVQQKGRLPNNFMEFIHTRLDTIPQAPAGQKYIIDAATTQVKSVPK